MNPSRLLLDEVLGRLPPEWSQSPLPMIQSSLRKTQEKVVVLDDDPTGTQTVHDVSVLTEWSVNALCSELVNELPAFYLSTNSRSLPLAKAQALNHDIGRNLVEAARRVGRKFVVVSRSDSTLRGHFPGEVEALAEGLGGGFDAWLLIPFFQEGHRYTIDDIHYVAEGEWLVPAGETEFARDATFGYVSSNLRQWVTEKTKGQIPPEAVASISLADIRVGGPARVTERLLEVDRGGICIVNAASVRDIEVFTLGLLEAELRGRRFMYRTAASFVQVRAGQSPRALLSPTEVPLSGTGGGLIVVGSYVPRTTAQVEALLSRSRVMAVEVDVESLLNDARKPDEITRVIRLGEEGLGRGEDVIVFTSRRLHQGNDADESLLIGQKISDGIVGIVRGIATRPRYVLAKGGITSADIATRALGVKRALVLGQISQGVPVWHLGPDSRFPGLAYFIFPGNVGSPDTLAEIVGKLSRSPDRRG